MCSLVSESFSFILFYLVLVLFSFVLPRRGCASWPFGTNRDLVLIGAFVTRQIRGTTTPDRRLKGGFENCLFSKEHIVVCASLQGG